MTLPDSLMDVAPETRRGGRRPGELDRLEVKPNTRWRRGQNPQRTCWATSSRFQVASPKVTSELFARLK